MSPLLMLFAAALIVFGRGKAASVLDTLPASDLRWAALHGLVLCCIAWLLLFTLRNAPPGMTYPVAGLLGWYGSIFLLAGSLVLTLFPGTSTLRLARSLGWTWLYAAAVTLAGLLSKPLLQWAWNVPGLWLGRVLEVAAFSGVKGLLTLFYANTVSDPSQRMLGTTRFHVEVLGGCSGVEGLTLMLVLSTAWLIFARRELRMARALLLLPVSLAAVWLMNIVRIAALIAIGDAGYGDVAIHGFHSVAGWILFNAVALGFLMTAQHLRWLRKDAPGTAAAEPRAVHNVSVPYLLPFLAVLAVSMVGHAATGGFDWTYPLRLVAALSVLWWFRADYRRMNWQFGWLGPAAGAAVFAMWFALSRWHHANGMVLSAELARLAVWQRVGWITARVFAAVVTVPVAEELAFRGYLARRIDSADIEAMPFARMSVFAILVSSFTFGAMHGSMWIAGSIAGVVFALVAKLRGRLGEAVAAHATANLLIAAWVLLSSDYGMW